MTTAKLIRHETGPEGTFGELTIDKLTFKTGELPWLDNVSNISCIPAGTYLCKWTHSPHFNRFTYEVMDVKARAGIRIHPANFMGDTRKGLKAELNGCIALGRSIGQLLGQKAIVTSKPAVDQFEAYLSKREFTLVIEETF